MELSVITSGLRRGAHICLYQTKKHIDLVELIAGGICVIAGTTLLVKNAEEIGAVNTAVKSHKDFVKEEDERVKNENTTWEEDVDESRSHFIMRTRCEDFVGYVRTTWKADLMIAAGLGLSWLSNATVHKQLEVVTVAYAGLQNSYNQYRKRVREDVGPDKDYEYFTGSAYKTVEVLDDGTVIETTTPLQNEDSEAHYLPHSFFFDESNANFTKSAIANRKFLEDILRWANMTLERDGMIIENDIFHAAGAKKTVSGQTTVLYYRNPDGTTNHISFGIEDNTVAAQRFRDGLEPVFLVQLKYDDGRSPEVIDPKRLANLNWFLC
jgi:hypothetical protein